MEEEQNLVPLIVVCFAVRKVELDDEEEGSDASGQEQDDCAVYSRQYLCGEQQIQSPSPGAPNRRLSHQQRLVTLSTPDKILLNLFHTTASSRQPCISITRR